MLKYCTVARETNDYIEIFDTEEEAKAAIAAYEEEDKKDEIYEPDFYEILCIKQSDLIEWSEEVRQMISKSDITMEKISEIIGVPLKTIYDWVFKRAEPTNLEKIIFRLRMKNLVDEDCC